MNATESRIEQLSRILKEAGDKLVITDEKADQLDHRFKSVLAKAYRGMSPIEINLAYLNWLSHLAISPGKQLQLTQSFWKKQLQMAIYSARSLIDSEARGPASKLERRVSSDDWQRWPFKVLAQGHQSAKDWVNEATSDVSGVSASQLQLINFLSGQMLDAMSPANFPLTNPDLIRATIVQRGKNLGRGLRYLAKDTVDRVLKRNVLTNKDFVVGDNLATTQGKVVFQNNLLELIQYSPTTEEVGTEPVLICPAWIMKYYILDLSAKKSLAKYLVDQGKTVFMISWKNPDQSDRNTGFEDYINHGLMAAIDAVSGICPRKKINAVGYCIGGTLLYATAALMARENDDRLNSLSFFAAQSDFSEAGEITRFISDSQLEFLDNLMWKKGYLPSENMGKAFGALRASDLIYGSIVDRYFLGKEFAGNELMAWNADGTRMPYRMHSEYLHKLYSENQLARNLFIVNGKPVSLTDIITPMFVLGTETDHVAPWQSVYKIHGLTHTHLTFCLTSGGHNAGVISGPSHPRRHYRLHERKPGDNYTDPATWVAENDEQQGSWWPVWDQWLEEQMSGKNKAPKMGAAQKGYNVLRDAPGEYVFS
jgi:polyhydroxyalkanoate synthase